MRTFVSWPIHALLAFGILAAGCATHIPAPPNAGPGSTGDRKIAVGAEARHDFQEALRQGEARNYDAAITAFRAVAEQAPHVPAVHINLGIALCHAGSLEEAAASIERALELDPRHPIALNELGIVYRKTGQFERARESYAKVLAIHPNFHLARRNLAILCDVYLRDEECALQHYTAYTAVVPDDEAVAMWVRDLRVRAGE